MTGRGLRLLVLVSFWAPVAAGVGCAGGEASRSDAGTPGPTDDAGDPFAGTATLRVPVPDTGRVYVNLTSAALVAPGDDPAASSEWDLAFGGYDVYTNSGPSGGGMGGGFGPLGTADFLSSAAPEIPFIQADKAGGAFLGWYEYDGTSHVLYSRFHVYGVRNAQGAWKVQIITYYGERSGAPTSALYRVRYANVSGGATTEVLIDGTAGGLQASATSPSGCLDLQSGAIAMLTADEAQASTAWDVCFRRDTISVNGEAGGPGDTAGVDLQADASATETLADVQARTAAGEQPRFDAVTAGTLATAIFRGDHVVSAFESGHWVDVAASPPQPAEAAWLVVDASGAHRFLVSFSMFENPTTSSPGTIVMRMKPVSE